MGVHGVNGGGGGERVYGTKKQRRRNKMKTKKIPIANI